MGTMLWAGTGTATNTRAQYDSWGRAEPLELSLIFFRIVSIPKKHLRVG